MHNPEDDITVMIDELPPDGALPLSVCVIAAESDAHYLVDLLKTLPPNVEVIVLWNKRGELSPVRHRKDRHLASGTIIRYFEVETPELHFAQLRNLCIAMASRPWIMYLDADDRLMIHQHGEFKRLAEYPPGVGGLICSCVGLQKSSDKTAMKAVRFNVETTRIFRNGYGFQFEGAAHEQVSWSISEKAFQSAECPIIVHHVGYEVDADAICTKLARNVKALSQEVATCTDEQKLGLWRELLARDSHLLMNYQG